jgi:sporulation protein YlmC with PRC-barrel domain
MRRPLLITLVVLVAIILAVTVAVGRQPLAGGPVPGQMQASATATAALFAPRGSALGTAPRARGSNALPLKTALTYQVRSQAGQRLGKLDNLLVNMADGEVPYVLVSSSASAQTNDRLFPIPATSLQLDAGQQGFLLDADAAYLDQAPSIGRQDVASGAWIPVPEEILPFWGSSNLQTRSGSQPALSGTPQGMVAATPGMGREPLVLASQALGVEVYSGQNDKLGEIQDMIVDFANGQVSYAVTALGGVLSSSKKLVPVPISAMQYDAAKRAFVLGGSSDTLTKAPGFAQDQWPDMTQLNWDQGFRNFWQQNNR